MYNLSIPIPYETAQHLHPGYWGKHAPLDNDATPESHATPSRWDYATTITHTRQYLARLATPLPIQQFQPGDIFDASAFPGAFLVMDNETLGVEDALPLAEIDFSDITPATRTPYYMGQPATLITMPPFFRYVHDAAIARADKRRRPRIIGSYTQVTAGGPGGLILEQGLRFFPSVIEVGAVRHTRCDHHVTDTFERINRVDVLPPAPAQTMGAAKWLGAAAQALFQRRPQEA